MLTEWESHSHFVALFVATGLLHGEQPQSLLLMGPSAEGKSSMVKRFGHWRGVTRVSDITVSGLREVLKHDEHARFLAMDELQRIFAHPSSTVENLVGLMLSLMSGDGARELIGPDRNGTRTDLAGRKMGIISAVPTLVMEAKWRDIAASGLLSRFRFLAVKRSPAELLRVKKNIIFRTGTDLAPYPMPAGVPEHGAKVTSTPEADTAIAQWVARSFSGADARAVHLLTVLSRSVALLNGRTSVRRADVAELRLFEKHLLSVDFEYGGVNPRVVPPLERAPSWAPIPEPAAEKAPRATRAKRGAK